MWEVGCLPIQRWFSPEIQEVEDSGAWHPSHVLRSSKCRVGSYRVTVFITCDMPGSQVLGSLVTRHVW